MPSLTTTEENPMNDREQGSAGQVRALDDYRRLAPTVERAWVEDFVLEQRLIGVPGARIGDALAVVESHVSESGESAGEAFGDPTGYAREAAPTDLADDELDSAWILGSALGLVGMLLTIFGFQAWLDGEPVQVTVGVLATAVLAAAAFAALHLAGDTMLRFVLQRPAISALLFVVHFGLMVAAALLFPTVLTAVPALGAMSAGLVLLVVGTGVEWRSRSRGALEDPIVGPGEQAPTGGRSGFGLLTVLLMPILTVLMAGFSWAIHLLV